MDDHLNIYVAGHKKTFIPACRYLVPIQVGSETAETLYLGYVHDNSGTNISCLNPDYCELTALYWIWKNDRSPVVGLFHYRRFLIFDVKKIKGYMNNWKNFHYVESLTQKIFDGFGFNSDNVRSIMDYDILIPQRSRLSYRNIDSFYKLYERSYKKELDYALEIIRKKYPHYQNAVEECKASALGYHCNMFIMKREVLEEYCSWLFEILDEMHRDIANGVFVTEKKRLMGYIAEFMMGIFICQKQGKLKIGELPAVYFNYTDGKDHYVRKYMNMCIGRLYRWIFPIGSKREKAIYKIYDTVRRRKV